MEEDEWKKKDGRVIAITATRSLSSLYKTAMHISLLFSFDRIMSDVFVLLCISFLQVSLFSAGQLCFYSFEMFRNLDRRSNIHTINLLIKTFFRIIWQSVLFRLTKSYR
ncbi:unnamed protein product [Brugia timori]|uniref:XK-related protein n=1 Tax=Brugia timori TaxID=42155 RepID=A0A0R3Q6H2_9BILA|nr:unnamed protein product [Brugia timori]